MTRTPTITRATAAVTALLLSQSPLAAKTLKFIEHATGNATSLHGGKAADNVGDVLTFANPVFDAGNKSAVGSDQGYCVRLVVGKSYECHWTLMLAHGQLMVDGPFLDTSDSTLAITGGTGAFSGASGEMDLHARDAKGTEYDFVYKLK